MLIINSALMLFLILMPSLVLSRAPSSQFSSPDMDASCNTVITLNGDDAPGKFFSLTSSKYYKQNFQCLLTIKGSTVSQRIVIVVEKLDVDCNGDKLLIYDGKKDSSTLLNKEESKQCGKQTYYLRTVNSNTAIIEFISNSDGRVGAGFTVNVAINFPVSACPAVQDLYKCANLYCVSRKFKCDTRNWCGDDSQKLIC